MADAHTTWNPFLIVVFQGYVSCRHFILSLAREAFDAPFFELQAVDGGMGMIGTNLEQSIGLLQAPDK